MNREDLKSSANGRVITVGRPPYDYTAFVPNPLPPKNIPLNELGVLLSEADRAMGALSEAGSRLKNPYLLIAPNIRREAVLSSRIEGTETSLSDLFFYEAAPSAPPRSPDIKEVVNYVRAVEHGLTRVRDIAVSVRLIKELHKTLLTEVRGSHATPGELRTSQNWIGPEGCKLNEATFVPPPVEEMKDALSQWERFYHDGPKMPPLISTALLHYQFEAIHPFLDGNGRVGRLLITLILIESGVIPLPLLYLSGYFEKTRPEYYARLLQVSTEGDWKGWLKYFLVAVKTQAREALDCTRALLSLREAYLARIKEFGATKAIFGLVDRLIGNPYVTVAALANETGVSYPASQNAIQKLVGAGILKEITGFKRNRVYLCSEVLSLLEPRGSSTFTPGF